MGPEALAVLTAHRPPPTASMATIAPQRAPAASRLDAQTVTHLQRLVGNRAVAQIPTVQRGKGTGGGKFTGHAAERGQQRGISNTKMREIMRSGNRGVVKYDDPDYDGSTVYFETATSWAVIVSGDGRVITTYNTGGFPKARWTPR